MGDSNMSFILDPAEQTKPFGTTQGDAVYAGMALILADAATAHLRAHEPERAAVCVAKAQRCLAQLI